MEIKSKFDIGQWVKIKEENFLITSIEVDSLGVSYHCHCTGPNSGFKTIREKDINDSQP